MTNNHKTDDLKQQKCIIIFLEARSSKSSCWQDEAFSKGFRKRPFVVSSRFCSSFTVLWWVLPYTDMSQPWVYMCPHPEAPSHLPPHPIPLGCPGAPAWSALFHASNLDWSSVSHMVMHMFQCYSLKSSHPHLLPQSPKVCSLYLSLFCCLV